ncbi:Isopenicillin N epimerase component 2 [Colletotrichum gloeosporioides]|uniref:Isopenicillin N epimerase component 2 n=1 Tax=Colletotrichum gloeosporioides TaxID=474922 RepID=A0A8H4CIK7_COLGL|nr:Isopenicillin N epimerase component 2 [Colletotrichum gloeosporioides]KAF3804509.1 Isopenicillin N epimerase component 2 [Colletotrichum gloeosporioides]
MVGPPPLTGIKVLEFAGLAPGPFAGMLLADAGASVLRIDRTVGGSGTPLPTEDMLARHKASVAVDLKSRDGVDFVKSLAAKADVIIDPFRPGVLEKLGLGPEVLCGLNGGLVYGRMTGFRRDGRYKDMAGHDINYLAVSGLLGLLGREGEKIQPPWNILADFAGGGAVLFQGVLMALLARERNGGKGQVVEANMVDGSAYLATFPRFALKGPLGDAGRGKNILDGGCPYYDTYETKDGRYMAVGALEPQFFRALVQGLELDRTWEERRFDRDNWPELRELLTRTFKSRTRTEWEKVFDGTDACTTPVLEYAELETGPEREGDQRPVVTLVETPCLAVEEAKTEDPRRGQGPGVPGRGYEGFTLAPGDGAERVLSDWFGWKKGKDFDVQNGGLILKAKSKL